MTTFPPSYVRSPRHIAIIMDGNGRWAHARGLPRSAGHKAGAEAVRRTVKASVEQGVRYLTLFGFSSENWRRPADEVGDLMGLLRFYLRSEIAGLNKENIQVRVIGDRARLSDDIVKLIESAERITESNDRLTLVAALSYGGRHELAEAARQLAEDVKKGSLKPGDISEQALASKLFAPDIPDPDLLIRTSGEQRISNFLLWQLAYTEMVFTNVHWPDFGAEELTRCIADFQGRDRRYGGIKTG